VADVGDGGQEDDEIMVLGLSATDMAALRDRGYGVLRELELDSLAGALARIAIPQGSTVDAAIAEASALAPTATVSPNNLYRPEQGKCGGQCTPLNTVVWPAIDARCTRSMVIGVVDTGADLNHPTLRGAEVVVHQVRDMSRPASHLAHGTAVVSLLLGNGAEGVQGLVPGARVMLADAFHSTSNGDVADTMEIAAGIDWLMSSAVPVIQMALTGPDNPILSRLVTAARLRGHLLIAAAGNRPGGATRAFPAAYPGVVGVSAAAPNLRPYRLGTRGDHVDLAAPGVNLKVAIPGGGYGVVSGSSFATPFVTAAHTLALNQGLRGDRILDLFASSARDLGAPGKDPVFGWGLLQIPASITCR
jgi:hypothetical protein